MTLQNLQEKYRNLVALIKSRPDLSYSLAAPILAAMQQAESIGKQELTLMEFGVANGTRLKQICKITQFLTTRSNFKYHIFGFDLKTGLPSLVDFKDHPEIWHQGLYSMTDYDQLSKELPDNCELIIGNIKDTVPIFMQRDFTQSPIGFIVIDVDLYSSTVPALDILKMSPHNYVPAVPMYFDDVYGLITYNDWCGEQLAICEFNDNPTRKIHGMLPHKSKHFVCQILDHPVRTGEQKSKYRFEVHKATFWG